MTRRVHVIHVVEKNIMTSTGCRGCSTLEKSTDTQHHSLAFRKDAFPSNVSLSSLTFKASQCVTWWHQNCMKQLILVSDSISRYSNVGQVERLRIFGSFRIVSGSPSHPAFGSMSLQGPHLKQNKRHKSVLDSFAAMNILISSEWHPFKTEHEEFAISTWRTIERFWG